MIHTSRRARIAAAFAALTVPALLATPALGADRAPMTIKEGPAVTAQYPAFTGVYPGHQVEEGEPTPDQCGNQGALQTGCDVIPLKIVPPNVGESDDWLVQIRIKWAPDNANTEDLDVFLFDNRQIAKRQDASSTKYTKVGQSASAANPEIIKVLTPALGDYNLVVAHFSGISSGYSVTGSISIEKFVSPIEAIDERAPSGSSGTNDNVVTPEDQGSAPVDFSADVPTSGISTEALAAPTALPEIAILPDADLDTGSAPISDTFAAPPALAAGNLNPLAPPKPVSGAVVAFWFAVVPALLVGGGWLMASRRNRTSFSFG